MITIPLHILCGGVTNIGLTWRLIILCVIHKLVKNDLSTKTIASDGATIRTITLCIHTNRSLNPKLIKRLHKSNGQNENKNWVNMRNLLFCLCYTTGFYWDDEDGDVD